MQIDLAVCSFSTPWISAKRERRLVKFAVMTRASRRLLPVVRLNHELAIGDALLFVRPYRGLLVSKIYISATSGPSCLSRGCTLNLGNDSIYFLTRPKHERLPDHPPLVHLPRQNYTGNPHGTVEMNHLGYGTVNACQSGDVLPKARKRLAGSKALRVGPFARGKRIPYLAGTSKLISARLINERCS